MHEPTIVDARLFEPVHEWLEGHGWQVLEVETLGRLCRQSRLPAYAVLEYLNDPTRHWIAREPGARYRLRLPWSY